MAPAGDAIALALFALALVSIVRDRGTGCVASLAWAFAALVLPIIGPILWFTVGKRYPYGPSGGNR